jgi:hypothetical protein
LNEEVVTALVHYIREEYFLQVYKGADPKATKIDYQDVLTRSREPITIKFGAFRERPSVNGIPPVLWSLEDPVLHGLYLKIIEKTASRLKLQHNLIMEQTPEYVKFIIQGD